MKILNNIPVDLKPENILKKLRLPKDNIQLKNDVYDLIDISHSVAKPKVLYTISYVDNRDSDSLYINDIKFTSRILRVNLNKIGRVFPYIVTCGTELDDIDNSDDIMISYCMNIIKDMILKSTINYFREYLKGEFLIKQLSNMSPGSLEDWPITQQKELFSIFGNVKALIGVKLTDSFLMVPVKSVTGIFFPTEVLFESCRLCPREICEGRRVPFDPNTIEKYYKKT